ncbi:hypothetical protein SteCoe_6533 [Stentor coeruleus]|uniref:Protein kinase domain-containing protein n=1 Tax=Stentor coeruleus TaxID=5963 RepID=A0A1R2CPN3_9CILI|nr:hypothetical protein SteCoe_6533 [Stentor coeruleus]
MGDYKISPSRAKKQEHIRKTSKDIIIIQKPKSKTRLSTPENLKNSSSSNFQSNFGNSLHSKFLEPKYIQLLAKYLAAGSRQNSPQEPRYSPKTRREKKTPHRRAASNVESPVVIRPSLDTGRIITLEKDSTSQEQTLKNEQKRTSNNDKKCAHSSSAKSLGSFSNFETMRKEQEEQTKKDIILHSILNSIKTGNLIATNANFYLIGKQLGKGAFGKVYLGLHRLTGLKVAIKTIDKSIILDDRTRRKVFQEVYVMKKIFHQNVIRLLEVFESSKHLMIVLEYSGGGDLLQLVKTRGSLTELEGKHIFSQLIEAIQACHTKNIIHRDVKLDNILITTDFTCIKLCDFGVSRSVKPGEKIYDQCGTPAYLAPEIIADRGYDPFYVDIWSMGVLLYAILTGTVPFRAKTLPELHKLILRCKYDMPDCLSLKAQDLIRRMLNPIPHMRISLEEMKIHPWLNEDGEGFMEDSVIPRFVGGFMCSYRKATEKEILMKMKDMGFPCEFVYQSLKFREINHVTATYYLLEISTTI